MNLFQTPEDQIPNINAIITGIINNNIRFHTIQLFRRSRSAVFAPEGTGILVDLHGVFCLFTSKHIVENSFDQNLIYFKLGPEEYILCTGNSEESETNIEKSNLYLAYIILDLSIAESLTDIGYKFLPNAKILTNHDPLETPQYAVAGFPKPINDQDQENTQTNGSYIIGPMAPANYYDNHIYTKDENFIMPYATQQKIMTGVKTKSKELYDFSGIGHWYISITKNQEKIEYNYHLIGIITELYIHKKHQFLITSKINLITDQLKTAIS
jgi:hypothetical protein